MSRRDKVVTLAVVGGILILLGVLTNSWWRIEGGAVKMGLRSAKICVGDFGCASVSYDAAAAAGMDKVPVDQASFVRYARFTFWIGWLAGLGLLVHAWAVRKHEYQRLGYAAAAACAATVLLIIATAGAFPDELSGSADKGWSFYATLFGCVLGTGSAIPKLIPTAAVAGARDAVGGLGNKIHRAAVGPLADLDKKDRPDPKTVPKARIHKD